MNGAKKNMLKFWEQDEQFQAICPTLKKRLDKQDDHKSNASSSSEFAKDDAIDNTVELHSMQFIKDQLYFLSEANFREQKAGILAGLEIIDEDDGATLLSAYEDGYDRNNLVLELFEQMKNMEVLLKNEKKLRADLHYIWCDAQGETGSIDKSYSFDTLSLRTLVDELKVSEPRAENKKETIILYACSAASGEKKDYNYKENVVDRSTNSVTIRIPLDGSVKIDPKWEIEELVFKKPESEETKYTRLFLTLSNGGVVEYNKGNFGELFHIDKEHNVITFKTAHPEGSKVVRDNECDSWKVQLDLSRFSVKTTITLTLHLVLKVHNRNQPAINHNILVTVSSAPSLIYQESSMLIEPISICWGCLRRGSRIRLADGSQKPIEAVRIGDMLMSTEGYPKRVIDICTGHEDIFVVLNVGESDIYMTLEHPIMTADGWKQAGDLIATDKIIAEDGCQKEIKKLDRDQKTDQVYSLCFEEPGAMICESVVMGDFFQQNSLYRNKTEVNETARKIQDEMRAFKESIHRNQ